MSILSKLRGTIENLFQIGKGGPNIKNNSGAIEFRNSADNAFAITRGATPISSDDLTPKLYVDSISASSVSTSQTGATVQDELDKLLTDSISVGFDGQGFVLVSGTYVDVLIKNAGYITGWTMANTARVGGTDQISIDIRKCNASEYTSNPYPITSIVAAAPVTFTSAGDYTRVVTDVSTWTTTLANGDWLRFYISSATVITNVTLKLNITRT